MAKSKKIYTPIFRASFVAVFNKARQMQDAKTEPKYEITAIFDPARFTADDKRKWAEMVAAADAASMEKFKKPLAKLPANFHRPYRPNEEKEHLKGYVPGGHFAKLSSKMKPGVVGSDGRTLLTDPESVYAGCYCIATVNAYAYDNISKGVAFGLQNVMFVRDGERLDSRTDPEEDFGEMGLEEDELLA